MKQSIVQIASKAETLGMYVVIQDVKDLKRMEVRT